MGQMHIVPIALLLTFVQLEEDKTTKTRCPFFIFHNPTSFGVTLNDGWMICDFTSFSTVFQSYQDDGRMIMKGCVQWNPVYG